MPRSLKCLYITSRAKQSRLLSTSPQFTIGGNGIEFVDKWPHLGHIISAMHDNKVKILVKETYYAARSITYFVILVSVIRLLNCLY